MRGLVSAFALMLACAASLPHAQGFTSVPIGQAAKTQALPFSTRISTPLVARRGDLLVAKSSSGDVDESSEGFFSGWKINPPYALAYVAFIAFAYARQAAEPEGASMEVIQQFIADPLNPGFNELFLTVFNLLGFYFAPFACLLMPGAKGQKLPATPFLLGSMFGGYGVLGLYTSTREPRPEPLTKADLGWFTANVLENKAFNWIVVLLLGSAYITSGAVGALSIDPGQVIGGYGDIFWETAIAAASSFDFLILTLAAASLVPEDLSRRGYEGKVSPELVALSTLLLPGVGAALYCALRPSLEEE